MKKTMRRAVARSASLALTAAAASMFVIMTGPAPVEAQDAERECRCVDAAGNEIESCTCLRTPRMAELMPMMAFGVQRARLGISLEADREESEEARGARVSDVLDGGPADRAGLRRGDVITRVGGQSLSEPLPGDAEDDVHPGASAPVQRLVALARDLEPGEEVEIEYLRDGERRTVTLEAEELSDRHRGRFDMSALHGDTERLRERMRELTDGARAWSFRGEPGGELRIRRGAPEGGELRIFGRPGVLTPGGAFGLELVAINPALGEYFGADEGVLVANVDAQSGLGLEPGDVVLAVGDRAVTTPERLRRIVASYGDDEDIVFRIIRDGEETTVTGRASR